MHPPPTPAPHQTHTHTHTMHSNTAFADNAENYKKNNTSMIFTPPKTTFKAMSLPHYYTLA